VWLGASFAALAWLVHPPSALPQLARHRSPHAVVRGVDLSEVAWTDGFWADRFATCRYHSVPAMWRLMRDSTYKPFYEHFLIAAGEMTGEHQGAAWNDGDFYKWIEGACSVYAVTRDPRLAEWIEDAVAVIKRAQRSDGYLHTPVQIRQRNGDRTAVPFQNRHNFEMYNMGHLITAACVHYRVFGDESFLRVARRTADFLDRTFADPTPELARNSVCPSHYMAMFELYRTTGEPRYRALGEKFLTMRNLVTDGADDNQDRVPFLEQREAVGHAVRANYLYAGAADAYLELGTEALWTPLAAIWRNVTTRKLYLTGGCGALYDGASPDGSKDQNSIARVHQAYGRNYQLPNTTAHNETCAAIGGVLWNWRMFLATGHARYIDVIETTLYNAVLSGVSLSGTDYFYVNPLRHETPLPTELRWSRERVPFVTSYCCPPNVVRTIAQVHGYAYALEDRAVLVNLYGGSRLATKLMGKPLQLVQETDYPWDGRVRVRFEAAPDEPFELRLRMPGWARAGQVSVNGDEVMVARDQRAYWSLERAWRAGDVVELVLEMPSEWIESHPLVEETRNQVALRRGPVVYCLETADLPRETRISEISVVLPGECRLVGPDANLGGVVPLEAKVARRPAGDWDGQLYRPRSGVGSSVIVARFVPYFVWANRGPGEMSVWLPVVSDRP
jgi:hypothetical protein